MKSLPTNLHVVAPPEGLDSLVVEQLGEIASQSVKVWVSPDVHPGKGGCVGIGVLTHAPRPILLGNDVGCGFSVFRLSLKKGWEHRGPEMLEKLIGLDMEWGDGEPPSLSHGNPEQGFGTLGGGNHFLEIQRVREVVSGDAGVEKNDALLFVHSGSRSHGESLFRTVLDEWRVGGGFLEENQVDEWFSRHQELMAWATANRAGVAERVAEKLRCDFEVMLDVPHNYVERVDGGWLHRKGANPTNRGLTMIAGTRETESYLVKPIPNTPCLPHGAGRRLTRSAARTASGSDEFFLKTRKIDGIAPVLMCGDSDVLREERPAAYRNIHDVVRASVEGGLCEIMAIHQPIANFKRSPKEVRSPRKRDPEWKQDRRRGKA